jgi:hypothetical protein
MTKPPVPLAIADRLIAVLDVNGDGLDDLIVGAPMSDLSGKVDAGKSYVVFGKKDNTAINLSTIASCASNKNFITTGAYKDIDTSIT